MQAFWESNWSITILRVLIVYQKKKIFGDHSVVNKSKVVYNFTVTDFNQSLETNEVEL